MTERLADIGARIGGIRQLGTVVNAMRGMAAARAQEARRELEAVERYAGTIAAAIGRILPLAPPASLAASRRATRPALVLFCAEEGFAGAFSERVLDAAGADIGRSDLFLIGTRGGVVAAERGLAVGSQNAMPSHSLGIPKLADTIAGVLYTRIAAGTIDRLDVAFAQWQPGRGIEISRRRLFPYDFTVFPRPTDTTVPLLTLAPPVLLADLTADYLYAQLCTAALHAFAAENEARLEAMAAARNQVERKLSALQATQRQIRQEEITAEIIELAAGETASRSVSG